MPATPASLLTTAECKPRSAAVAQPSQKSPSGGPTIKVAYIVLGDTLDICMVMVEE
jgi:hypothetical protein